jgi:ATP-dependent Lon protease
VLIPKDNAKDIKEIPGKILKDLELILVEHMDEVLKHSLVVDNPDELFSKLTEESEEVLVPPETSEASEEIVAH